MGHSKKPLDARLRAAADMALEAMRGIDEPRAADIGCDHGFMTAYLLRQRPGLHMVAGDVSEASLAKTRILVSQMAMDRQVETCCGDGLSVLEGKPPMHVILIAGLGGKTIAEILTAGRDKIGEAVLILQANTEIPELRRSLAALGLGLEREAFPEAAGRQYVVLQARAGAPVLEGEDAFLCGTAVRGIESMGQRRYLTVQRDHLINKAEKLRENTSARAKTQLAETETMLESFNRILGA